LFFAVAVYFCVAGNSSSRVALNKHRKSGAVFDRSRPAYVDTSLNPFQPEVSIPVLRPKPQPEPIDFVHRHLFVCDPIGCTTHRLPIPKLDELPGNRRKTARKVKSKG
jgi:hypothetical protein